MPRIAGINIPDNKRIEISLTYVYGIGRPLATRILKQVNVDPSIKAKDLTQDQVNLLKEVIEKQYKVEGELRREIITAIRRLKEIGSWRGMRHTKKLPVRGQRTKTNTRTIRGNVRKTVGSGRKPASTPT